jgi:hypothetical protein
MSPRNYVAAIRLRDSLPNRRVPVSSLPNPRLARHLIRQFPSLFDYDYDTDTVEPLL